MSRIKVITKERAGVKKHRIVLNTKKSDVLASSQKAERVILPRALDAVFDLLDLMLSPEEAFEFKEFYHKIKLEIDPNDFE